MIRESWKQLPIRSARRRTFAGESAGWRRAAAATRRLGARALREREDVGRPARRAPRPRAAGRAAVGAGAAHDAAAPGAAGPRCRSGLTSGLTLGAHLEDARLARAHLADHDREHGAATRAAEGVVFHRPMLARFARGRRAYSDARRWAEARFPPATPGGIEEVHNGPIDTGAAACELARAIGPTHSRVIVSAAWAALRDVRTPQGFLRRCTFRAATR